MSVIEHINAGRFAIKGMPFDTGDTKAMKELVRVLKPNGKLCLTTDMAKRYYPPPGLWKSKSHRIYDKVNLKKRLVDPCSIDFYEESDFFINIKKMNQLEPVGYDFTIGVATFLK
jgi:ubiquinone/menaquinone biosynthesis C-methylase UbiE